MLVDNTSAVNILFTVYFMLNVYVFALYGIDKRYAVKNKRRISETRLISFSFLGGIGAFGGMYIFRHKTKKPKFIFTVTFFCAMHIIVCYWLVKALTG